MHKPKIILRVTEPIDELIDCRSKIRKWAYDNAYTLTFVLVLFVLTWMAMVGYGIYDTLRSAT